MDFYSIEPEQKDYPLAFIGGCRRSGTTLLRQILGNCPDVAVAPELAYFTNIYGAHAYIKSLKKIIKKNIETFERRKQKTWDPLLKKLKLEGLEEALKKSSSPQDYFWRLANFCATRENYKLFIEKTPTNLLYLDKINEFFPSSKIIVIIRDGHEACASATKRWGQKKNFNDLYSAGFWKLHAQKLKKHLNNPNVYIVRYEELIANPKETLVHVFKFLGLIYHDSYINNLHSYSSFQPIKTGNQNALYKSRNFHTFFNKKQQMYIEWFMRKELKEFNYPLYFNKYSIPLHISIIFFIHYQLIKFKKLYLIQKGWASIYIHLQKKLKQFFKKVSPSNVTNPIPSTPPFDQFRNHKASIKKHKLHQKNETVEVE